MGRITCSDVNPLPSPRGKAESPKKIMNISEDSSAIMTMAQTESTTSSTSHTMTALPTPNRKAAVSSDTMSLTVDGAMAGLFETISPANRSAYVVPTASFSRTALASAKETLDKFAGKLADEQAQRLVEQRRKRKRGEADYTANEEVLRIRKVHVEGFEVGQVWPQAQKVILALRDDAERVVEEIGVAEEAREAEVEQPDGEADLGGVALLDYEGEDAVHLPEQEENTDEMADEIFSDEAEAAGGLSDDSEGDEDDAEEDRPGRVYVEDPHKLNDGFFSIEDFNKQTGFLEQQDTAADPYTGEASDEEDIDWDADPMSIPIPKAKAQRSARNVSEKEDEDMDDKDIVEEIEEEEDGPTFGNMYIDAPEGASDEEEDENSQDEMEPTGENTNDVMYKDFFEPPPRKAGKGERQTNYLDRQSRKAKDAPLEDEEAGMERAMADVRRDLFDEDSEQDDSEDALSDLDPADPRARRSAHERRQAKVAEEIRKLEAASIVKREWTLSGEARAADRPLNSLLEEDLDFERTGKPVPVITAEVSEDIESLIKRRILAQQFDEVIRRRPDALSAGANTRRGAFELDDSKPQQSLAEIYEEEHVKANNPDTYISKADEKLRNEEQEIELLWKDLSAKLDALSSWHYKPKPPAPSLTVVGDVPTISMEDAQPTTASGINGTASMLAPQEIYKAGKDKIDLEKGEVVPKNAAPVARGEMTREQKLRRRRREKERIRKSGGVVNGQMPEGKKTKEKRETVGELRKGGVKVIGRKGEIRDAIGNKVQAPKVLNDAGRFKL